MRSHSAGGRTSNGHIRCWCNNCHSAVCARAGGGGGHGRAVRRLGNVASTRTSDHLEVRTANTSLVGKVNDEAAVAKVCADAILCRDELIIERQLEGVRSDLAVLAAQVTDLASLGEVGVTRRILATNERVEMSQRLGAVAVGGNGVDVDVVGERTALLGKSAELNLEPSTNAIGIGCGSDGTLDVTRGECRFVEGSSRERGRIHHSGWVVNHNSGIAESASLGCGRGKLHGSCGEQRKNAGSTHIE